jgi:hypothetical protein
VGLVLREVLEVLEVEEVEQGMILLQAEEQPILEAVVVAAGPLAQVLLEHLAVQVSSSLNTSPNLITKSSNHQAHGLHLLALLRSST